MTLVNTFPNEISPHKGQNLPNVLQTWKVQTMQEFLTSYNASAE